MDYKQYIAEVKEKAFKIDDMEFSIESITLGDECDWFNYYIDSNGKENIAKLSLCKATKLKKTPFTQEWISTALRSIYNKECNKEWSDLSFDERLDFLRTLESGFASKLFTTINSIDYDNTEQEAIKNC